jgi:hypothetical protein
MGKIKLKEFAQNNAIVIIERHSCRKKKKTVSLIKFSGETFHNPS